MSHAGDLFTPSKRMADTSLTVPRFDGADIQPADHARLADQIGRVYAVLEDGDWWSVQAIAGVIELRFRVTDPEISISAQLRNLRKPRFGGHQIERKREGNLSLYRLVKK
jgi:hypothetical protein